MRLYIYGEKVVRSCALVRSNGALCKCCKTSVFISKSARVFSNYEKKNISNHTLYTTRAEVHTMNKLDLIVRKTNNSTTSEQIKRFCISSTKHICGYCHVATEKKNTRTQSHI